MTMGLLTGRRVLSRDDWPPKRVGQGLNQCVARQVDRVGIGDSESDSCAPHDHKDRYSKWHKSVVRVVMRKTPAAIHLVRGVVDIMDWALDFRRCLLCLNNRLPLSWIASHG